ncbi:NADH:flavin oxidoreductase [Amycolatopsis sp. WQ 127309]|uniref:NADH:flavin oxidoreductase n=1 Tax=Amycolatopsis sp. WQ 127309 TaxID=2932773 RepID=UPI001FF4116D|nr:NADH:flavin oxidoreductase [Amycolatopsis sp. WQ 127309]UOZ06923.1 NADH:flavin oxidoreductase [Amycolatopsis sp. WQ 127309]
MTAAPATTFAALFEPLPVGRRLLRNRLVQAPMSVCYGDSGGFVTREQIEHYGRRAQGGAGLVVTENFAVSTAGRQLPRQTSVFGEEHLPGLRALAGEITRHGALAMVQLVHAGRYAGPWERYEQDRRLAPSAVPFELTPGRTVRPQEMTPDEITAVIIEFGEAAALCERAGFDGVDLHAAQGFLIASFLSPRMNRRTDAWGGGFAGRTRFLLEVVREARRRTGPDFLIGVHLLSDELLPGGWSLADAVRLAPLLTAEGAQILFPVTATFESLRAEANRGLNGRRGFGVTGAAAISRVADVPVVAIGGLGDPLDACAVLERGDADAVGLARSLFADPDWPAKVAAGTPEAIRGCPCDPAQCVRTQLTGATCGHWPATTRERGFLGYEPVS